MKRHLHSLILGTSLFLLAGCVGVERTTYDSTKRAPTASVDVFKDGDMPTKQFKVIQEFAIPGKRIDEMIRLNRLIAEAKAAGADGLIFYPAPAGFSGGVMAAGAFASYSQSSEWVYKGKAIVYTGP